MKVMTGGNPLPVARAVLVVRAGLVTALALVVMPTGCSEKKETPDILPLSGKVVAMDLRKNTITVEYQLPKRQEKATDTAKVTEATEIQINGVIGKLADIRVGEHARGDVLIEGKGDHRVLTVLRIYVERPVP